MMQTIPPQLNPLESFLDYLEKIMPYFEVTLVARADVNTTVLVDANNYDQAEAMARCVAIHDSEWDCNGNVDDISVAQTIQLKDSLKAS